MSEWQMGVNCYDPNTRPKWARWAQKRGMPPCPAGTPLPAGSESTPVPTPSAAVTPELFAPGGDLIPLAGGPAPQPSVMEWLLAPPSWFPQGPPTVLLIAAAGLVAYRLWRKRSAQGGKP